METSPLTPCEQRSGIRSAGSAADNEDLSLRRLRPLSEEKRGQERRRTGVVRVMCGSSGRQSGGACAPLELLRALKTRRRKPKALWMVK